MTDNAREPNIDEDHLYNKYESMKMANERNMREKFAIQKQLDVAVKALEEINRKELDSQRPGGGYSSSARISYEALNEIARLRETK